MLTLTLTPFLPPSCLLSLHRTFLICNPYARDYAHAHVHTHAALSHSLSSVSSCSRPRACSSLRASSRSIALLFFETLMRVITLTLTCIPHVLSNALLQSNHFYAQQHRARAVFELHLFSSSLKPSCAQAPHAHAHAHTHALSRQRSGAFLHVRCATTELMLMPHPPSPLAQCHTILTLVSTSTIYDCTLRTSPCCQSAGWKNSGKMPQL